MAEYYMRYKLIEELYDVIPHVCTALTNFDILNDQGDSMMAICILPKSSGFRRCFSVRNYRISMSHVPTAYKGVVKDSTKISIAKIYI